MRPKDLRCPSCGAQPGEPCYTPVDNVNTLWDHDTRILAAMFTDAEPAREASGLPGEGEQT